MNWQDLYPVVLGYILIAAAIAVDLKISVKLWKEFLIASVVSLVQLAVVGFVILLLLKLGRKELNLALVLTFYLNGARIAKRRLKIEHYSGSLSFAVTLFSISAVSTLVLLMYGLFGILTLKANSVIPLAGIVTAAAMRSLSLGFDHFNTLLNTKRDIVLEMAALGVEEVNILKYLLKDVLKHILVPAIDTLKAAGIVHIPGIMVGLLVAGVLPVEAAVIQFVILATLIFVYMTTPAMALSIIGRSKGLKLMV